MDIHFPLESERDIETWTQRRPVSAIRLGDERFVASDWRFKGQPRTMQLPRP